MQRDDHVRTQGGVGHPCAQKRGLRRNHPADTWIPVSKVNAVCPVCGTLFRQPQDTNSPSCWKSGPYAPPPTSH